ncbi:MAG: hypothetical protein Q9160_007277 [Pyrenula sp. 1 TL-2023]
MASEPEYLSGNHTALKTFLDKFDTFLFDCDGVLWSGDTVFPNTVETLSMLRKQGKRLIFVTNNSTKSREDYLKKLTGLGIPATADEIFTSSHSTALYLSLILRLPSSPTQPKTFILGESGIESELRSQSCPFIGGTDPSFRREITPADYAAIAAGDPQLLDPTVGAVVVGLDFHISYLKLALAYHYIKRGAVFIATNTDSTLPSAGTVFPGAGATAAPLVTALKGQEPLSMGKPSRYMMEAIERKVRFERGRACMVGDRVETDIRFGVEGGLGGTLAVLTGVSGREDVVKGVQGVRPMAFVERLGDLLGGAGEGGS